MRTVYLDNNATTPVDPRVLEKMLPYFLREYGNASSAYPFGWTAEMAVESAREHVAVLIGCDVDEVYFTSGATESNNWFLRCFDREQRKEVITSPLEHKSILETLDDGELPVRFFPINPDGTVRLDSADTPIPGPHSIVTSMGVNNEIHSILDIESMAAFCHEGGAVFHCDGAQAVGRIPISVHQMKIDALSFSGHKIYGPKGVGGLFVRRSHQARLRPMLRGGGQEKAMRAGTLAVPLIVGLGEACRLAILSLSVEAEANRSRSARLLDKLRGHGLDVQVIGPSDLCKRQPGSLCLEIEGLPANRLCECLPEIAISQGSACNSRGPRSHVIQALGISAEQSRRIVRLCFGRFNTDEDVDYVAGRISDVVKANTVVQEVR